MSPARVAPDPRAETLRKLLAAADGCLILLTDKEREVIKDAIALYDPEGQ